MSQSPPSPTDRATLISFDGGIAERVMYQRPDRYRLIQADLSRQPRIARGRGYSYAAASFGAGSVVQDVGRFNRLLRFDPTARIIEVEAAVTLADLLTVTSRAGLCLPVQPDYPAITIGGCIAANVHGKNPFREGTFVGSLLDLTLFHPDHGVIRVTRENPPGFFDLTCGGYGLTGVILTATLRLEPLAGDRVSIRRVRVGDPLEAIALARDLADDSMFADTWHDAAPRGRGFGRGFVYHGLLKPGPVDPDTVVPCNRVLTATARARLPFSLWQPLTVRAFTSAFWHAEASRPEVTETTLFDTIFPFAQRSVYFRLFGRPGLAEYQALVPHDGRDLPARAAAAHPLDPSAVGHALTESLQGRPAGCRSQLAGELAPAATEIDPWDEKQKLLLQFGCLHPDLHVHEHRGPGVGIAATVRGLPEGVLR